MTCDPDDGLTHVQSGSPGLSYVVPQPGGVITSWSVQAPAVPPQVRLKTARHQGGNSFTVVGESAVESLIPSALNSFETRVAVQAGETLGYAIFGDMIQCIFESGHTGFSAHAAVGDLPPGTTMNFSALGFEYQLDVSAVVEPDADHDGFGDETQDGCPTDDATQGACLVPETAITKGPKDKTRKRRATFEFSSSLAGATFNCKLDGESYTPCSSPMTYKVGTGRHTFQVRAVAKGQIDPSPAADQWKLKKKKPK